MDIIISASCCHTVLSQKSTFVLYCTVQYSTGLDHRHKSKLPTEVLVLHSSNQVPNIVSLYTNRGIFNLFDYDSIDTVEHISLNHTSAMSRDICGEEMSLSVAIPVTKMDTFSMLCVMRVIDQTYQTCL